MTVKTIPLYQIDAFTRDPFKGNPAAVCLLPHVLDDVLMQAVAAEMNLSETAFVMRLEEQPWADCATFSLRWFTPTTEVKLCGHATLATSVVLFDVIGVSAPGVIFKTLSGDLIANHTQHGIELDFPIDPPVACDPPADVVEAIGVQTVQAAVYGARSTMLLLHLADAAQVRTLRPDFSALLAAKSMEQHHGLIVTADGDAAGIAGYDFVSRFFAPWLGINEDPVTGSAHTLLTPYWAERLGKREMSAYQASARGGELGVRLAGNDRVKLVGKAAVVFKGELYI